MVRLWRRAAEGYGGFLFSAAEPELSAADLAYLGPLLGFRPAIAARYEEDTQAERIVHLRISILIGLIFYNIYGFNNVFLFPDLVGPSFLLRVGVLTPCGLGLAAMLAYLRPAVREALVGLGTMISLILPTTVFALSTGPLATYSVAQFPMILVFGCMLLVLRPRWALASAIVGFAFAERAVLVHPDMPAHLIPVLTFQLAAASGFALYGNYQAERGRRLAYLRALSEKLRSDSLEADKETLVALSGTDPLTGVPNRRAFDSWLASWTANRGNIGRPISLLMIDVDYFKRYNDRYGHVCGDVCLREVAQILSLQLREGVDLLARYGGEEFAVLLPRTEAQEAARIAERLRQAVAQRALPHDNRGDERDIVTVSVGIAMRPTALGAPPAELIAAADGALYQAKNRGRNCCVTRTRKESVLS